MLFFFFFFFFFFFSPCLFCCCCCCETALQGRIDIFFFLFARCNLLSFFFFLFFFFLSQTRANKRCCLCAKHFGQNANAAAQSPVWAAHRLMRADSCVCVCVCVCACVCVCGWGLRAITEETQPLKDNTWRKSGARDSFIFFP